MAQVERHALLADQVERELKGLSPAEKQQLAKDVLTELTPVGGAAAVAPGPAKPAPAPVLTPAEHAAKLCEGAAALSVAERAAIAEQLLKAGLVPAPLPPAPAKGALTPGALAAGRKALGLADDAPISEERLGEVAVQYMDMLVKLHAVVRQVWEPRGLYDGNAAGLGVVQRSAEWVGGSAKDATRMMDEARAFQRLAAQIVRALPLAPRHAADELMSHFAPGTVEEAAPAPTAFTTKEHQCWKHYRSMWETLTSEELESRFKEKIVRVVSSGRGK
jgi:hypothetical protein